VSATVVGLTGPIGAGKSTVAAILRELGAKVLDADALVRDEQSRGTVGYSAIVQAFGTKVLERIWDAAGAQDTLTIARYAHLVGGCRMGTSPENSVVDADHRAWKVPNLLICDGSVMPTQGAANPALTIMALASRLAERLAPRT